MHASWQQKCSSRQKRGRGIRPPALEKMANAPEISAPLSTLKHVIVMEKTSAKPGLTEPCEAASSSCANSERALELIQDIVRDAASLALARHPPTRSDFLRKIVVSPSRNLDEQDERTEDLRRIFEAFERGEDPAPAPPEAAWLPAPTRRYPL